MSSSGKLEKLKIVSFLDAEQSSGKQVGVFEAYYNPASLSISYGVKYNDEEAIGTVKTSVKYDGYNATTYSFDLMIDGTGASAPNGISKDQPGADGSKISVPDKVQTFMDYVYKFQGENHEGCYLQIQWGKSSVPRCVLTSVNVTYDLFSPNGDPLRAKLACQFKEYSYKELSDAEENRQSPDVTHLRVITQGETLPGLCEQIYGDARLYQQIARYNNLTNYRNLKPGERLYFPPLTNS